MKVVIKKAKQKEIEYKAGDIVSIGNPYENHNFLLTHADNKNNKCCVDLSNYKIIYTADNFDEVVKKILICHEWNEWVLIESENATITLNCENSLIHSRTQ